MINTGQCMHWDIIATKHLDNHICHRTAQHHQSMYIELANLHTQKEQ